ncbi:hypothetical protein HY635_02830 [Candidatus Uhrbacteria bacterium]|nr:hypothetical protein [Candidatus Uhrbacteria bacterium]
MTTKRWMIIGAIALAGALVVVWRVMRPSTGSGADAQDHAPSPFADQADAALAQACDELAKATPETIGARIGTVRKIVGTAIVRQPWIRDQFAWFELHKLEGVLISCGIRDEQARALLATLHQSGRMRFLIQDARRELCRTGAQFAEAEATSAWSDDQRLAWDASCTRMLSAPVAGTTTMIVPAPAVAGIPSPAVPGPPPVATPATGCSQELGAQRSAMADRSLGADAWIAYGRTLAACGPDTSPWDALRLAGGRDQFINDYVVPFINGDVTQGSPFQTQATELYNRIVTAWEIEG